MKPIQKLTEKYLPPDGDLDLSIDSLPSVISERPNQAFIHPLPYQSDPKVFQKWRAFDNAASFKENREVIKKQANQHFKPAHIGGHAHHQNHKVEYVVEMNDQNQAPSSRNKAPYSSLSKKVVKGIKSSATANDENQPGMVSYGIVGAERPVHGQEYENLMRSHANKASMKPPQLASPKMNINTYYDQTKDQKNQYVVTQQQIRPVSQAGRANMREREGILQEKNFNAPQQQIYNINMYTRQLDERKGSSFDQGNESQSFHQSQMSERPEYQPLVFDEHESHPSMFNQVIPGPQTASFQKKEDGMFSYSAPQNAQIVTNSSIIEFTPNEMTDYQLMTELTERTRIEKDQRRYIDLENAPNPMEQGMRPSYGAYVPEQERSLIDVVNNRYQSSGKKMKDVEPTVLVNNLPLKEYALNFYRPSARDLNITDNSSMMEGTRYYSPESRRYSTEEEFHDMDQPPSQRNTHLAGTQQSANASFVSCVSEAEAAEGVEEPQGRGSVGNRESEPNYGSVVDPNTFRSQFEQQQHYGLSRITEEDESLTHNVSKEREISPKKTETSIEINPLIMSVESMSNQPYLMNFVNDPTSPAAIAFKNSLESQRILNNHIELESQRQTIKSDQTEKETHLPERQSESQAVVMERDISEIIPASRQSIGELTSHERSFKSPAKHEKSSVRENSPSSMYYLDTSVATRNFEPALSNKNHNIAQSSNTGNQSEVSDLQSLRNTENQLQSVGSEDTSRKSLINQEINAYSIENLESIDITATLEIADTILKNSKKPEPAEIEVTTTTVKPPVKLLHSIPSKLMPDPWPGYPEENYLTIRLINAPPEPSEMYSAREEKEKKVFESNKKENEESGQSIIQYHWNQARQSLETLEREVNNNTNTSVNIEPEALPKQEEQHLPSEVIYTPSFVEAPQAENWVPEKSGNELLIKEVSSQMAQITEEAEEKYNNIEIEMEIEKEKERGSETKTDEEHGIDSQTRLEPLENIEKSDNSLEQKSSQMIFETRHSTSPLNTEPAAQRFSQDINLQAFSDISNVENRSSIKTEGVPSGPIQVHLSIDELEKQVSNNEKKLEGQQQNIENYYWAERHNSLSKQLAQGYPQGVVEQKRLNSPLGAGILTQSIEISPSQQIESHFLTHSDTEAYLLNKLNSFSTTPFQVNAPEEIDRRHSLSDEKLDSQRSGERPSHSELDADKLMNSANYQDFSHEIHEFPNENLQAQIDNMFSYDGEMDMVDSNQMPLVIESSALANSIDPRTNNLSASHAFLGRGPLPVIEEINSTHIQETSANDVDNSLEFKRHFSSVDIDKDYCMTEPEPVLSRVLTDSPNPMSNRSLNPLDMGLSPGFEIVQTYLSEQKAISGIDAISYSNQISDDNIEDEIQKLQAELMLLSSQHRQKAAALNIPPSKLKLLSEEEKALLHQSLYEDFKRREDLKKAREMAKKAEEERTLAELKTVGATKGGLTRDEQANLLNRLYVVKDKSKGSDTKRHSSEYEVFDPETLIKQVRSPLKATSKVVSGPAAYHCEKKKDNKVATREKKTQGKENHALTKKVNSSQELHRQRQILVINNNKSTEASIKARLQLPVESSQKSRTSISDSESFEMLLSPEAMKAQTMSYDGFLSNYNSMVKTKLDTPKTKTNPPKMRNSTTGSFKV